MLTHRTSWSALLVAVAVVIEGVPMACAEPLSPPTTSEEQYLVHLHQVLSQVHNPVAFRSDGELLSQGRFACQRRSLGLIGTQASMLTPAVTQLAFIYLCP
ncbi:hypothetical protein A5630_20885 [Mycolicibacterium mucogenicum]|uniref:DUF732 domain-containing protein n=1 Tax=Mycolicibacterium mucogenicum TaxID=56689 RepID=A0A1A3H4E3_MYCMU|nr:hypothetical protein A5630_20885 [Mycolicibacterium mucogenicum]